MENFVVNATVSVPDSFQRFRKMPPVNEIHQLFIIYENLLHIIMVIIADVIHKSLLLNWKSKYEESLL